MNKQVKSNGMNFFGVLTIVFVVLKLVGVIDWSWWYVLLPLWGPAAMAIIVLVMVLLLAVIKSLTRK